MSKKDHDEGPQVYIQSIMVCPRCDYKAYGQFTAQFEDVVTKKLHKFKGCPVCLFEKAMMLLDPQEMVEWKGNE